MTIRDGGVVSVGDLNGANTYIGYSTTSLGWLTVTGSESKLITSGTLVIGREGNAFLRIEDGGTVSTSGNAILGGNPANLGVQGVRLTGTGSSWNIDGTLKIDSSYQSGLYIYDGARVESGSVSLGVERMDGGGGGVGMDGGFWKVNGDMTIGHYGFGQLDALAVRGDSEVVIDGTLLKQETGTVVLEGGHITARNVRFQGGDLLWNDGTITVSGGSYEDVRPFELSGTDYLPSVSPQRAPGVQAMEVTHGGSIDLHSESPIIGGTGDGRLLISGGSTFSAYQLYIGNGSNSFTLRSATGTVVVTGDGSQLDAQTLYLGRASPGYMSVLDGGAVQAYSAYLGFQSSGFGSLSVSGTASLFNTTGDLTLGYNGVGRLQISDGAQVRSQNALLGYSSFGSGTASISGTGSRWQMSRDLQVGREGTGDVYVLNGAQLQTRNGILGILNRGSVTVSGVGSAWTLTNGGHLHVGDTAGQGTLEIAGGGRVATGFNGNNGNVLIGYFNQASGQAIISGTGSQLTVENSEVVVGYIGNGSLVIEDHGYLESGHSTIGAALTGVGNVTLTGSGSHWSTRYNFHVGYDGRGSLDVRDGARVDADLGFVAYRANSTGTASVTGAGSVWTLTSALYLGGRQTASGGFGTLHISDGGKVVVGGTTKIWEHGSLHLGSGGSLVTGTLQVADGGRFQIDAGANYSGNIQTAGKYVLNGQMAGNAVVQQDGTFGGSGALDGLISGGGLVSPGNSPGILDAAQVDPLLGTDFLFEFRLANLSPDYSNRTAPGNDILHLTDSAMPFISQLTADNKITVDFQVGQLNDGDVFEGGFFTNLPNQDFVGDGTVGLLVDYEYLFNGGMLDSSMWQVNVTTTRKLGIDFGPGYGGVIDGRVMSFSITQLQAVPEPSSMILCALGAGGHYWRRRKSKKESLLVDDETRCRQFDSTT